MEKQIEKLTERVNALETNVKQPVKKQPRKPSEYNTFMAKFIPGYKKDHPKASHQDAFAEGAKEWKKQKK